MKTYIMVDIEANGPIPGDYSMTSLGAVIIDNKLDKTFSINIKLISNKIDPDRIKFVNQENAVDALTAMKKFKEWITKNSEGSPLFISDNNGFDWMFVCWYFWHFLGENPFGYNSVNLNSLNKGLKKDLNAKLEVLRDRNLTHDALNDAMDNGRIFQELKKLF
jgi:hypothetical protein